MKKQILITLIIALCAIATLTVVGLVNVSKGNGEVDSERKNIKEHEHESDMSVTEEKDEFISLENAEFATALSKIFGKDADKFTKEDFEKYKLISVSAMGTGKEFYVMIGNNDAVDEYKKWFKQVNDQNVEVTADVSKFSHMETFETEKIVSDDLKYFTGAEVVELGFVEIKDSTFFANFNNLKYGTFSACSITDISSFSSLDLSKIESLNLSGNDIFDWSTLESIAEKVIVSSSYSIDMDDDGNYTLVPVKTTLAEQMKLDKEDAKKEQSYFATPYDDDYDDYSYYVDDYDGYIYFDYDDDYDDWYYES